MKVVLLDGSGEGRSEGAAVRAAEAAEARGAAVRSFRPGALTLAPCQGEFDCWTATPGVCRTDDEARDIARAIHDADLVVYLSPLTFGGYTSGLKKAMDRTIGLVQPFFESGSGLTHHAPRYATYPATLYLGLEEGPPQEEARDTFLELARGNARNICSPWTAAEVVPLLDPAWPGRVAAAVERALAREGGGPPAPPRAPEAALAEACAADGPLAAAPRTATLLVGSARPRGESSSESLGRVLLAGLETAGVATRVVHAVRFLKDGAVARSALDEVVGSELLVVSSPLYVDTLPYLVTRALEAAAARLAQAPAAVRAVAGILNCGFPEAAHNRTGVRVLRAFTRQAGLTWAGALAMGAGEALHGRPVAEAGALVRNQARALRLAGARLALGEAVPAEASALMALPLVPTFLFRWLGHAGWALQARAHGVGLRQLKARPYDEG